jgi:exopolyphosphatase/guanosine-5'-triphosphate,3'-diphosphate pyrophosphatase
VARKPPTVAVIDIGSNSIKVLVATRATDGGIATLATRTVEARISAGISRNPPVLAEEGMVRGLAAISELLAVAAPFRPEQTVLVATSAVRDAVNGAEFRVRVLAATGHDIRILSGDEEANLIGRGLTSDPALAGLQDFYVFDLGGGSLECLAFRQRHIEQAASLQLGCVRLTERFVADSTAPFSDEARRQTAAHVRVVLGAGSFRFALPGAPAVGTGGTITTVRVILAADCGLALEATPSVVTVAQLRALLDRIAPLPLAERRRVPGMPAPRADVLPVALATVVTLAEANGLKEFHHSFRNLRYGLADALLAD